MALYNPNYQMPYQQMQNYQLNTQQANNGIVWVQGEAGARAYPVAAGNSVMLLDSESPVFYIKSTDNTGMPTPLRIFDFTERTQTAIQTTPAAPTLENDFATKADLQELRNIIQDLEKRIPQNQLRRRERDESTNEHSDRKQQSRN